MESPQYLSRETLLQEIPQIEVRSEDLGSTDTYNESKILETYQKLSNEAKELVYKAAIQLAIIGYGNKNYGFIRLNEKEIIKLQDLFKKYDIKFMEKQNQKYDDYSLSARRLLRLFRFQIQNFIIKNKRPSYLFLKYSDRNPTYVDICFPGGEHLVENKEQAIYLYNVYNNLDRNLNTKFCQRLQRVYIARGILPPEFFANL